MVGNVKNRDLPSVGMCVLCGLLTRTGSRSYTFTKLYGKSAAGGCINRALSLFFLPDMSLI